VHRLSYGITYYCMNITLWVCVCDTKEQTDDEVDSIADQSD